CSRSCSGYRLAGIDEGPKMAAQCANYGPHNGVVCANKHHSVNPAAALLRHVFERPLPSYGVTDPTFFGQGHKERAGARHHLDIRIEGQDGALVSAARDRSLCGDDADAATLRRSDGAAGTPADQSQHPELRKIAQTTCG